MAGAAARDPSASRRLPSSGPILARARTPVPPFRLCNAHTHTPSINFTAPPPLLLPAAVQALPSVKCIAALLFSYLCTIMALT
jgi:hypothetical protein